MRKLLILSFSPIAADARVLKQVSLFADRYEVTTCGFDEAPAGVAHHIRIPDGLTATHLYGRFITLRWYRRAYDRLSAVKWARGHLSPGAYDVILANDVEAVPLALDLTPPLGVHADLHEYTPRLHEDHAPWLRHIKPFYDWLCRRYVSKASSWTTVSNGLAREYEREFGFAPAVVTNATPYVDREPGVSTPPLRLVHSGACLRDRSLLAMIDAVELADAELELHFYLTPNDPGYLDEIKDRAAAVAGVEVHDPVPYADLVETLSQYDAGIMVLPPVTFSYEWALPNKVFDFVQARLGVIVGPSAEMAHYVTAFGLGVVTDGFTPDAIASTLRALTAADVNQWRRSSHAHAHELSAETQVRVWADAVDRLMAGAPR